MWGLRLSDIRIATLCGDDTDLLTYFRNRRARFRHKYRMGAARVRDLNLWFVEIMDQFAELWETTRGMPVWEMSDVLDAGVLTTREGNCRNIPSSYKAAVITEARNGAAIEHKSVLGLMVGLRRTATARKFRLVKRHRCKDKQSRTAQKLAFRTAKSQTTANVPDPKNLSSRIQKWDRCNYFAACKRAAASQCRLSIALDSTDVSFKKVMNATMSLPRRRMQMWLPPMDIDFCSR